MKKMKCISLRAQLVIYITIFLALHTIGVEMYSHTMENKAKILQNN